MTEHSETSGKVYQANITLVLKAEDQLIGAIFC